MYIKEKSANGTILVTLESELYEKKRIIFLNDEINTKTILEVSKQIIELSLKDQFSPIKLLITSCGGSIDAGYILIDLIKSSKVPIDTYCIGMCYSMAALIFASGRNRYMLPHSKLMLHQPLISECGGGNADTMKSLSDSLQKKKEEINKFLSEITGKKLKEIEKATGFDNYFSASESIDFGLADEIITIDKILE